MDALTQAARKKKDSRPDPGHQSLQNVQIDLRPGALRLTAADGFILAVVELPLTEDSPGPQPKTKPQTLGAHALRKVAADLRKGSVYDPHLTLTLDDAEIALTSERGGVTAKSLPNPHFPDIAAAIPDITADTDCQRTALNPGLVNVAARICSEIGGNMTITAASNSGPMRIDCVGKSPPNHNPPPRAVIALMPIYIRWDDPEAIRLRPERADL